MNNLCQFYFIQESGTFSATIVLDFGDWGCIGSHVEATFQPPAFEGTGRPKTPPMMPPPLMPPPRQPPLPYQPRHLAKPSRNKDVEIVLGVSPERSPAAFVRPPREQYLIPDRLRDMFDNNDQGGLRRELSQPSRDLLTYAHNVRNPASVCVCVRVLFIDILLTEIYAVESPVFKTTEAPTPLVCLACPIYTAAHPAVPGGAAELCRHPPVRLVRRPAGADALQGTATQPISCAPIPGAQGTSISLGVLHTSPRPHAYELIGTSIIWTCLLHIRGNDFVSHLSQVPGLAENRPSVLCGDEIYARHSDGSSGHLEYQGCVHFINMEQVWKSVEQLCGGCNGA